MKKRTTKFASHTKIILQITRIHTIKNTVKKEQEKRKNSRHAKRKRQERNLSRKAPSVDLTNQNQYHNETININQLI